MMLSEVLVSIKLHTWASPSYPRSQYGSSKLYNLALFVSIGSSLSLRNGEGGRITLSKRKVCRLFRFVRLLINVSQLEDGRSITLLPQLQVLAKRTCSSSSFAARRRCSGLFAYHLCRHMNVMVLAGVATTIQRLWARQVDWWRESVSVTWVESIGATVVRRASTRLKMRQGIVPKETSTCSNPAQM